MAASQVKVLLDELAKVLGEMGALDEAGEEAGEGADGAPGTPSPEEVMQNSERMTKLLARAEDLKKQIAFYESAAEKEKEYRAILERAAPASQLPAQGKTPSKESNVASRTFAVPRANSNLKAFLGPDAEERAYRAGMHLKGYVFGNADARQWCRDHGVEHRTQAGGFNSLGGVLVAPEFSSEVIRLVEEYGAFPANAKRSTMTSDTLIVARRTGGLTARPVGESVEPSGSDVTFDNVTLTAKIWGVANRAPNSLIEDAPQILADTLALEVSQAFAVAYDEAGFIGDGTSTYHGTWGVCSKIVDSAYSKSVVTAKTGGTTFGTLTLEDFTNVISRLPVYAMRNAKWYISPAGFGASMLRLLMQANGNNKGDVAGGYGSQFMGFPVVQAQPMVNDLSGTAGKVLALFGDLAAAADFATRREVNVRTATERYIELDQTLTFATSRVAIVVHDLGSTSVAGPIVALKAAAS